MSNETGSHTVHLRGEVIETVEVGGHCVVKVALTSCCLEFTGEALPKARLGDTITIDAGISISNQSIRANT